jgi:hypothetical protein
MLSHKIYPMNNFNALDLVNRNELLKNKGSRVITISYKNYCVTLYLLDKHFVERYFNIETSQIEMVQLAMNKDLEKYLDFITLNELYWI